MEKPLRPENEILGLEGISKQFHDILALDRVSLSVMTGEICAVLGENGAGKTALLNIISGIVRADQGQMYFRGAPSSVQTPKQAADLGIYFVSQEPEVVNNLTIEQMIFLNQEHTFGALPLINRKYQLERVRETLDAIDWHINPNTRVRELSFFERKLLLIARALCFDCRLLIMDDITANLENNEFSRMMSLIRQIQDRGITVIFITHMLEAALSVANHIVVLSNGRIIADHDASDKAAASLLTQLMAGPDQRRRYPHTAGKAGRVVLSVEHMNSREYHLKDISLSVREGEIVGIVSLQERSRRALARMLCGALKPSSGQIVFDGRACPRYNPASIAEAGVTMMDAGHSANLFPDCDAHFNISAGSLRDIGGKVILSPGQLIAFAMKKLRILNLNGLFPYRAASTYSYGTQQKLVLLRNFCADRKLVIMIDPTAGIDAVGRIDAYNLMNNIVRQGRSIVLISSDLQEIAGMADRVYIIFDGSIVTEMNYHDATPGLLMDYATGKRAHPQPIASASASS